MEGDGNGSALGDESPQNLQSDGEASFLSGNLFLDHVGEVTLTQNPDGLSWKLLESSENVSIMQYYKAYSLEYISLPSLNILSHPTLVFFSFFFLFFFGYDTEFCL